MRPAGPRAGALALSRLLRRNMILFEAAQDAGEEKARARDAVLPTRGIPHQHLRTLQHVPGPFAPPERLECLPALPLACAAAAAGARTADEPRVLVVVAFRVRVSTTPRTAAAAAALAVLKVAAGEGVFAGGAKGVFAPGLAVAHRGREGRRRRGAMAGLGG